MRNGLACGGMLAVVALAIAVAGCSGGEELGVSEPVGEAPAVAEVIMATAEAEPKTERQKATSSPTEEPPAQTVLPTPVPTAATIPVSPFGSSEASFLGSEFGWEPPPKPTISPKPPVEFPDGIALLGRAIPRFAYPYEGFQTELLRIYKRKGEVVRETLFVPPLPEHRELHDYEIEAYADYLSPSGIPDPDSWSENLGHIAAPDGSSIIMTLCVPAPCWTSLDYTEDPPSSTAIYESRDGGLTWQHLASFDLPWVASSVLPVEDENGQTRVVLEAIFPFFQDDQGIYSQYPDDRFMLWPSGERGRHPLDLYLPGSEDVTEMGLAQTNSCQWCLILPDGRLLQGLTIIASETGEQWPIRLPNHVRGPTDHYITPLAIQQGPFLRVPDDLDGCLPVLAEPSPDAEELACMVARVLLTDLGEAEEIEGTTWHRVRTPAGIEGWADGGRLE